MVNVALIPNSATEIAVLDAFVDGYPEATHRLEIVTGGEPLEDGRNVTDHAVARQEKLVLLGWVSDINFGADRPAAAWARLRELHNAETIFAVVTEWGEYPEMIITRAEAAQRTRGMQFTLELEQIIRVGITDNDLPAEQLSGPAEGRSGEVTRGRNNLEPAGANAPPPTPIDVPPPPALPGSLF